MEDSALHTVTHARLRALQGDCAGAVTILRAVLARRPDDPEAARLLAALPGGPVPPAEPEDPPAAPPQPARAAELAAIFRRSLAPPRTAQTRLARFLAKVTRHAR